MWGGWLDETHILHQSEFHTGPHGMGSRRHIYFSDQVHNGSCGVGGWMRHIFSTSQSSKLVLMGWNLEETSIFQTRFTMVHVGWVAGCYTYSPPVRVPYWSSRGGIQKTHQFLRLCPQWLMWVGWLDDEFSLHRGSEIDMPFTEERGLRERYKSNHPSQGYQLRFDHRAGKFILAHQHLKLSRA